jgi:CubicO group peptidase (beta-lactamase class C family)
MEASGIDKVLERAVADGVMPGVVAMVVDADGPVYEGAAGTAPDTLFRIASMTKAMTSVAALQLLEKGKLELDQPISSIIPAFGSLQLLEGFDGDEPRLRPLSREATVQHLLTHTSGLSYFFTNPDLNRWYEVSGVPDPMTGKRECLDAPFVAEPGTCWEYGISTAWLGLVVEAMSGQALDAYLVEHVFAPLGMTEATFYPSDSQRERLMAVHARTEDGGLAVSDIDMPDTPELAFGGEGAYATAGDYMRFLRALLNGGELDGTRILKPETVDLMFTDHLGGLSLPEVMPSAMPELTNPVPALPFKQGFGLGLHLLLEEVPGMRKAGSGDWAGLFNCYYWVDRASGIAAAIFTQLLPFFDERMVETLLTFEAAVYARRGAPAAA